MTCLDGGCFAGVRILFATGQAAHRSKKTGPAKRQAVSRPRDRAKLTETRRKEDGSMRVFTEWLSGHPVTMLAAVVTLVALLYVAWRWDRLAGKD
ncbi:MAG: hypothetical protein BAA02_00310 [Paenibacillaceae bacterium ZCTH02-B3]|nr:MAG: hypothetical protein BAA02_00310 [Paenibacillaceae bacterium ZCTH02-B3]